MDRTGIENRDLEIDIESGVSCSEEDSNSSRESSPDSSANKVKKKLFEDNNDESISVCIHLLDSDSTENLKPVTNQTLEGENTAEKKVKRKKMSSKKPPRPPRGPSLDPCDEKLIRELTELAMLKRARAERMKALKKMKASKGSSSNNNCFALVFTVLFFLVILFQGIIPCTRSSSTNLPGLSPESLGGPEAALISAQYNSISSPNPVNGPADPSQSLVEQVSGSDAQSGSLRTSG